MGNKVLVIDDEPNICDLIKLALSGKGYAVEAALTGKSGIEMARKFEPDIILLDMTMPDIDGIETAKAIRAGDPSATMPIVLMSGRSTDEKDLDKKLFSGILNKPFSIADLVKTAESYTKRQEIKK
jgi:DNA-binding response OmpR family regulator